MYIFSTEIVNPFDMIYECVFLCARVYICLCWRVFVVTNVCSMCITTACVRDLCADCSACTQL